MTHVRINKWLADHSPYSRRQADELLQAGRVTINGTKAVIGMKVGETNTVAIDGKPLVNASVTSIIVLLHKPLGYVCSRKGQGAPTVYSLLPTSLHSLDIAGRLDKNSSGLLVMTNDGRLVHSLTHPLYSKDKVYEVVLNKHMDDVAKKQLDKGVRLDDGVSIIKILTMRESGKTLTVSLHEGRKRQIRRTFAALGYNVVRLHRTRVGPYSIDELSKGSYKIVPEKIE